MIIWLCEIEFEREWIEYLIPFKQSIDIIVFNHSVDYNAYLQKYTRPFVAIHLSDETLGDDISFYSLPLCRHVFRNYWHPIASNLANVTTFGLGYKTGFCDSLSLQSYNSRQYIWCFAGNIHNEQRAKFIEPFLKLQPHFCHVTYDKFNSSHGLDVCSYRSMMEQSMFALCPIGHGNIDTFRLYEAMEAGAIPVAVSMTDVQPYDYWGLLFGTNDIPFVRGSGPDEVYAEVLRLVADYQRISEKVRIFWANAKEKWRLQIAEAAMQEDSS